MGYFDRRVELRIAASVACSTALFAAAFLWGPVDSPLRAAVAGASAGALGAALAGFRFPGWPAFSAALAFFSVGMLQPVATHDWLYECLLVACAALAWGVAFGPARLGIEQVFGVEFQEPELPSEEPPGLLPGLWGFLSTAVGLALVWLWSFPLAPVLALPAGSVVVLWAFTVLPRLGLLWPVAGTLTSLPLAYALPQLAAGRVDLPVAGYPFDLAGLPPASPWLLAGLAVCGAVISGWLVLLHGSLTPLGGVRYGEGSST